MTTSEALQRPYVDSSLLVTAVSFEDPAYERARNYLSRCGPTFVTSAVTEIEFDRALARKDVASVDRLAAEKFLAPALVVELTGDIRDLASGIKHAVLRTLDAVHVATALITGVSEFATLDARQQVAAEEAGLALARIL